MKNTRIKNLIIGLTVVVGGAATPMIPAELDYLYSYQYNAGITEIVFETATGTVRLPIATPTYSDEDKNGKISVGAFADRKGNIVYTQLDDNHYTSLGTPGGASRNPKKDELISALALLTPRAEAAIAFDAVSEDKVASGGATSLTYAHTNTGSNGFLHVSATLINHSATPSATYNGVAMTPIYTRVKVFSTTWTHSAFYITNPATGANNVVITGGGTTGTNSIRSGSVSYTGVDQSTPILDDAFFASTDSGNNLTIPLTTASAGWAIISGANVDAAYVAGTNSDTLRASYGGLADTADSGNDITAGTFNTEMTHSGSRGGGGIAISILPAGGGGAPPRRIIITQNDI